MIDIQSATAEIRRGKKKKKKIEETTGQKYNGLPHYIEVVVIGRRCDIKGCRLSR